MSKYDELKRLAEGMKGWPNKDAFESDDAWRVGSIDEDDNLWPAIEIQTEQWDQFDAAEPMAKYYAAANPAAILELIAENERLRNAIAGLLEWVAPIAGDNQDDEASQRELDSVRVAEAAMQEAAK